MPPKSSPNRKDVTLGKAKTDQPKHGRFDWLSAQLIAALIGASAVILAALIAHPISVTSLFSHQLPETEFDRPRGTTTPRTAFCFFHANPPAGYRKMVQRSDNVWLETQPDGSIFQHQVVGRVNYGPWRGVILRRLENRDGYPVELYVPDSGTELDSLLYRPPNGTWVAVSRIEDNISNCPLATDHSVNR